MPRLVADGATGAGLDRASGRCRRATVGPVEPVGDVEDVLRRRRSFLPAIGVTPSESRSCRRPYDDTNDNTPGGVMPSPVLVWTATTGDTGVRGAARRCGRPPRGRSRRSRRRSPTSTPSAVATIVIVLSGSAPTRRSALISGSSFCISSEIRRTRTRPSSGPATVGERLDAVHELLADLGLAELAEARDRVAVGRLGRVVEELEQPALDGLGHHVLPAARLLVHLLPGQPDHVGEQPLGEPVLAHHPGGEPHALVGQLEVAVALDGDQPVALHPGHGLRHRRPALVQPLGDPGPQRRRCPPRPARRWSGGTSPWCR